MAIVHEICKRRVADMHYEARVNFVREWYADRKVHMSKKQARDKLLQPWQYLQVVAFLFY